LHIVKKARNPNSNSNPNLKYKTVSGKERQVPIAAAATTTTTTYVSHSHSISAADFQSLNLTKGSRKLKSKLSSKKASAIIKALRLAESATKALNASC